MASPKLLAILISLSASVATVHYTILKPEGINLFDFDLPSFKMPDFNLNLEKKTKEQKASLKKKKDYSKPNTNYKTSVVDALHGVKVYDNGRTTNVYGRNTTKDGYNLGLRYQCVEFVKRYYYEYYNHKMPDSYGHAKEFFQHGLPDGRFNTARGLYQFTNKSKSKPEIGDLLIFGATPGNQYGHVAIISQSGSDYIEIIQQNPGKGNPSRVNIPLGQVDGLWNVFGKHILGWLRKV